ncbi:MAG TPA: YegP family protein [Candidatus Limadaptatus stercoravium]|nr:YegP family protein [Candidatus Limadaptatus stercoravium]
MGISTIQLILYVALAVIALFVIVMLIISAVFAKRHRDPDVDPLAGYSVEGAEEAAAAQPAPVQYYAVPAAAAAPARPNYPVPALTDDREEPDRSAPETYSDQTRFVLSEEHPIAANTRPLAERQGNWDNYDGEYVGYYYDPLEGCYFKGNAPVYVQRTYLPAPPPPVVKRVMPACAPITSKPKAQRAELVMKDGFDIAKIYGQYVIGSEGDEYYFTLYSNKGELLYASDNYASRQYCVDAIKRFKKHVLVGAFSVEGEAGDYHYKLVRNLNTYLGPQKAVRVDAEKSMKDLKYYAQTDVVR